MRTELAAVSYPTGQEDDIAIEVGWSESDLIDKGQVLVIRQGGDEIHIDRTEVRHLATHIMRRVAKDR